MDFVIPSLKGQSLLQKIFLSEQFSPGQSEYQETFSKFVIN